jgi:curli biogenesis system outer membrane secretion channel CsgG
MPDGQRPLRKKGTVPFFAFAVLLLLGACGSSGTVVTRGGGASLDAASSDPALGGRYRVAVAAIIDKTDPAKERSFDRQLGPMNQDRPEFEQITREAVLGGVRDMIVTELFVQDRFIVLEREALDAVVAEQEFSVSASAGDATRIPAAQLEGAELIVLGAVTAFDFGIMHLRFKRGYVAMDLRVIDARSGRVLSSVAVNGTNNRFGMDFNVHLTGRRHHVKLPKVLTYFANTPVEQALQEMVTAAVDHVAQRVEPQAPVN